MKINCVLWTKQRAHGDWRS